MPVNPYFNFTNFTTEQGLVEDLIIESIQIYGHSTYYIPRTDVALDTLLGEDALSAYGASYEIEMYLKSSESFAGQSEFMSKFGLQIEDQATFLVAVKRFNQLNTGLYRPRENDIVYIDMSPDGILPTNRYLFEIRFVDDKEQLFQLGRLYTYELRCEMMNFSHELTVTGVPEADAVALTVAYAQVLILDMGSGAGAFIQGETITDNVVTGVVSTWAANTGLLTVTFVEEQAFATGATIRGLMSNAHYLLLNTRTDFPTAQDPISDNEDLAGESNSMFVIRGPNPLLSD